MAQLLAGRYELGSRLGVGGMAEVVRGLDVRLHRPVAVKLMSADRIDAVTRERFRREARASAGFSHPHAVTTYDAGEDGGWLYLVMELVEGQTLAEHLAAVGRLAAADAIPIAGAVLDALGAAHDVGLVHRDVKPGNVLLGSNGAVKLADFGIARRFEEVGHDLTATGTFVGTARYASPEQLAGRPATAASDLYSTGVVLYEMLAGRPPFDGESAVAIAMAHHQAPVPDVRAVAPDVPQALADAVERSLAKDPADRFQSARAMRAALDAGTTVAPTAPAAAAVPLAATEVFSAPVHPHVGVPGRTPPGRRQRRWWWWWWFAAAVLTVVVIATLAALAADRSPGSGSATTIQAATTRPAVTTLGATVPPTSTPPAPPTAPPNSTTTTVPVTPAAPAVAVPGSVDELAALIAGDPDRFGPKAGDVVDELEQMDAGGNRDAQRARRLLERTRDWVDEGQLDPAVLELMQPLLTPLAAEDDDGEGRDG